MICCLSLSSHFYCQVDDLSKEPQVERELMLIKLNADSTTKGEVRKMFFVLFFSFHIHSEVGIHGWTVKAPKMFTFLKWAVNSKDSPVNSLIGRHFKKSCSKS